MPERSVTVRISATDNFSSVVDTYKRKMGDADSKTSAVADNTASSADKLGTAIKGVFTLALAQRVVDLGGQMVTLGTNVGQVKDRFNKLAKPLGDTEEIMGRLREATLDVATDYDIQQGANLLMQMGLAQSPEDLENIIGLITRIKKPTQELGDAINDFSLLLSNQSIMRLDNFGLSSARVRARINDLLASGEALNRSDAFKMAVMEEGAKAVDRLGSSAENARQPIALLTTQVENLFNQASSNVAEGAQGLAGILLIATGNYPGQQEAVQAAADRLAADTQVAFGKAMADPAIAGGDQDFINDFMQRAVQKAIDNPDLAADAQKLRDAVLGDLGVRSPADALGPQGGLHDLEAQINAMARISAETVTQNQLARDTQAAQMEAADQAAIAADKAERRAKALDKVAALDREINSDMAQQIARGRELADQAEQRRESLQGQKEQLSQALDYYNQQALDIGFQNFTGTASYTDQLPDFMAQDQADRIQAMADDAGRAADEMKRLADANPDMFTEDDVQRAKDTASSVGDLADEAQKAADAFASIKLSDIFGQTSGGTLGEINQMVLSNFQGTDEQKAALERQLALSSGQETQGSLFLQEVIAPAIADAGDDPELAAEMSSKINDILLNAALAGVDTNDEDFLAQLQAQIGDVGLLGIDSEALVEDFATMDGSLDTMRDNSTTMAEDMTTASDSLATAQKPAAVLAESSETAASNLEMAASAAQRIANDLKALTSKVHKVKVVIDVQTQGDDFQNLIKKNVRANGGKVPGAVQ